MRNLSQLLPRATRHTRGMTLVELMIGIAVGGLILSGVATVFTTSSRSFAIMGNYIGMDQSSRNALDQLTRNLRSAATLTSFADDTIVVACNGQDSLGTTSLTYSSTIAPGALTEQRTTASGVVTNTLLTGCDWLRFSLFDRSLATTTDVTQGKVIGVAWRCSRTVMGRKVTTEDMQQAQIVIRNQP